MRDQENSELDMNHVDAFVSLKVEANIIYLYTCMQNPRLRTVYRQRKWPLLAPVRKIMALGPKKMARECQIIALG